MGGYVKTLSLQLSAGVTNNISLSQSRGSAGNLTITGAAASGGVATLSPPRRVLITSAGDDSLITFTVYGTARNGQAISEVVQGSNTSEYTVNDFLTVTRIATSGATASTVTAGTNAIGSTEPFVVDRFVNPALYGVGLALVGTATTSLQVAYDDLSPQWDIYSTPPTWFNATSFTSKSANTNGTIQGPVTMIRLTNESGTGTTTVTIVTPFIAGAI